MRIIIPEDNIYDLPIIKSISYIDTLHISLYLDAKPHKDDIAHIKQTCESAFYKPQKKRKNGHIPWPHTYTLYIQRPSYDTLMYIYTNYSDRYSVSRVDVALDLITATQADAFNVKYWLDWHLSKQTRYTAERYTPGNYIEDMNEDRTLYTSFSYQSSRMSVTYADHASKKTGDYCCHLELRLKKNIPRTFKCKRNDMLFILANLDHRAFWQRHLKLKDITLESVGLAVYRDILDNSTRKAKKMYMSVDAFGRPKNKFRTLALYYLHANEHVRSLAHLKDQGIAMKHFNKLDNTPLLPRNE